MTVSSRLAEGDTAPDFTLPDDTGREDSLQDIAGQRVLVYFYPRANTPGCTTQACDFRDSIADLNDLDVTVVGISPDKPEKLAAFREDPVEALAATGRGGPPTGDEQTVVVAHQAAATSRRIRATCPEARTL